MILQSLQFNLIFLVQSSLPQKCEGLRVAVFETNIRIVPARAGSPTYTFEDIGGSFVKGDGFILKTPRPLANVRGLRDVDQYGP